MLSTLVYFIFCFQVIESATTSTTTDVFVSFNVGTLKVIQNVNKKSFTSRVALVNNLVDDLKENARNSQASVLSFLSHEIRNQNSSYHEYKSFWITNQLFLRNVDNSLISKLKLKFSSISKITTEENYFLDTPIIVKEEVPPPNDGEIQWGIKKVGADECWQSNNNGTGVVVGTIDSGVHLQHESLVDNFFGDYGWFDPYKYTDSPVDETGHGTHTLGTIVGKLGIGVAPGAKWMSCRGCYKGFCTPESLLSCGEFLLCPTDTDGNNSDCSKAPDVVSNSFGGGQGRDLLWPVFDAWDSAGISIVFSNGNTGPWCGTANSHADAPQVIGVGGTTIADSLYTFSSVGPTVYGTLKPDISAPGVDVLSAYHTGKNSYSVMSGTSMAAPHVAGAIAILKSQQPSLSPKDIRHYLNAGVETKLALTGQNCGGIKEDVFPNHVYGAGRLNVFNSLRILRNVL